MAFFLLLSNFRVLLQLLFLFKFAELLKPASRSLTQI